LDGNFFSNEIINNASNPKKNPFINNIKKIKPYDLNMKITQNQKINI
jgi:hypothetical protein